MTIDHTTSPRPTQPSSGRPRMRPMAGAPRATRPPTASSQALLAREKNAHGSDAWVNQMEKAQEVTAITPSASAADARDGRTCRRRLQASDASSSTAGQTR